MLHVIIEAPRRCHRERAANWRAVGWHCTGPQIYLDENHHVVSRVIKVTFQIGQGLVREASLRAVP